MITTEYLFEKIFKRIEDERDFDTVSSFQEDLDKLEILVRHLYEKSN